MQEKGEFNLESMTHKYCVSWIASRNPAIYCCMELPLYTRFTVLLTSRTPVSDVHTFLKGVPNELMAKSKTVRLPPAIIPEAETVVSRFEVGGHITWESPFGHDPLAGGDRNAERNMQFQQCFPDFSSVLHSICNNDYSLIKRVYELVYNKSNRRTISF